MVATTLWQMLANGEVVIPQIQRDYAQGREGKEYIRGAFLEQISNALQDKENKPLILDFVYGNIEADSFRPLDGQQRLTTLWLLHWYFIFISGQLNDDSKKILKNFTYQTRSSSREFCEKLCDEMKLNAYQESGKKRISDFIKSQTWFYSKWLQDPTINAMLRTLSGGTDISYDNIEGVFGREIDENIVDKLKTNITFYQLNIGSEQLPISDDLYIKMNARGKSLTHFENFKADLISWLKSDKNPQREKFEERNNEGIYWYLVFSAMLDGEWTDIFWDAAKEQCGTYKFDGKIDDIFFAFFNRYIANQICLKYTAPDKNEAYRHLCGTGLGKKKIADDSKVIYQGFGAYSDYISFDTLQNIKSIFEVYKENNREINEILSGISSENQEEGTEIEKKKITFIPQYEYENASKNLANITLNGRVYFHAVCLYLQTCENFKKKEFSQWMRVVKNITENAGISSVAQMRSCLSAIDNIGKEASNANWRVYESLRSYSPTEKDSYLGRQIEEEKEKAEKTSDETWERKIIEAENWSFFNGTIRFLYRNDNGEPDWNNFDEKFKNAKELFDNEQVSAETNKKLLKLFDSFEKIENLFLFTIIGYHARHKNWKNHILCNHENSELLTKVHNLLLDDKKYPDYNDEYNTFLKSGVIDNIIKKAGGYKYRCRWADYGWSIQKEYGQSYSDGVFVGKKYIERFNQLKDDPNISVDEDYVEPYYFGKCIHFEHNGFKYAWHGGESINRINNEGEEEWNSCKLADDITFLEALK